MKERYELICNCCNNKYSVPKNRKDNSKFCSKECFTNYNRCELICNQCGIKYSEQKYRKDTSKFCSKECYTNFQLSEKNPQRIRKITNCIHCKRDYEIHNTSDSKFCSRECYWNYRNDNPDIIIQSNQEIVLLDKECLNCGESYKVHPYRNDITKFCSQNCFNDYRREIITCPTCKKEMKIPKYENRIYCSIECAFIGIGKRDSKFSKSVETFLINNNINYKKESKISDDKRKVYVDFLLNNKLIIECYGDYWHCNPEKFSADYYHSKIQDYAKNIWKKDKERIEFLTDNNYNTIIVWEKDWKNKKEFFKKLKNKLNNYEIYKN